ncbi:MAG: hypothetical protein IIW14_09135, partial [Kiritimatiellae bacterium]|nr:hypothetical protein [Kiritimatiellia bacterium]
MNFPFKLENPLVVFDIESTGTSPRKDRIIELAAIKIGCDGSETESTTETEAEVESFPDVAKQNYGEDFHLLVQPQCNQVGYYWVKESDNDALSESVFARQQKLYEYLGVDMTASEGLGHDQYG